MIPKEKTPPVVSIISKKNSGKTTLLVKLIPELKKRGYTVGTLKHDVHGFDIDHEGKDSWRHKKAGADTVVISCPWKVSLIKDVTRELTVDEMVARFFNDADIVITEGYKQADKPKIEIFRKAAHPTPIHTTAQDTTLIAMVSDVQVDIDVPLFHIDDIIGLADFIETTFLTTDA